MAAGRRIVVDALAELPPGASRVLDAGGREIAVMNVDGEIHAFRNSCPHHGAPLCAGAVTGRMNPSDPHVYSYGEHGEILRCPWHGYEFRLADGRSPLRPDTLRMKVYETAVEDGDVVVYV